MDSHTLEFLQQGVWASLTGGWFYDLRQNVFCNTFHLYLWLFLLCFPFILHLYFVPSIIIYSIYCGTIGLLFTLLKLINHRLHKMFDTSQCIQEIISGEDLPESQKMRSQTLGAKRVLEDEGIELQVLNEQKVNDSQCDDSYNDPVIDDGTISLEVGARVLSSTIDLKVDVHRKNSSGSSDNLSLNLVSDCDCDTADLSDRERNNIVKEPKENSLKTSHCSLKCKHSKVQGNNFRLKQEEKISGYDSNEFILSQSDCFIAKRMKKSMEELPVDSKMSHSDCQISNIRESTFEKNDVNKNVMDFSNSVIGHLSANDMQKKNCSKNYCNNLKSESQFDQNKTFNMCNLISNGSCGILPLNQAENKENMMMNTGSLQLPLKDSENIWCNNEKGLVYWKQQDLGEAAKKNFKQSQIIYSNKKLKFSSPEIHIFNDNSLATSNYSGNAEPNEKSISFYEDCLSQSSSANEKSFLKILEESFDWWGGDYQCKNTNLLPTTKESDSLSERLKKNEEIKERSVNKTTSRCGLKFQIDSDEDLSDNRGSQSPLLCRRQNSKKDAHTKNDLASLQMFSFEGAPEKKIPRSFSSNDRWSSPYAKMNRTLSVDENVISYDEKNPAESIEKNINDSKKSSFSSFLLTVYDNAGNAIPVNADIDSKNEKTKGLSSDGTHFQSALAKGEMNSGNSLHCKPESSKFEFEQRKSEELKGFESDDGHEKIAGLDWLFRCQDDSAENFRNDMNDTQTEFLSKKSFRSETLKSAENRGAIPKVKVQHPKVVVEGNKVCLNRQSRSLFGNPHLNIEVENDCDVGEEVDAMGKGQNKEKEGDSDTLETKELSWRETYNASGSSATELSSLLPLSSLLSSLHPPTSPLLAAFLATRKEISENAVGHYNPLKKTHETKDNKVHQNVTLMRSTHKRTKKSGRAQRTSRSARVSSIPLVALASVVSSNSGIHIATSHDDTSQGAVHYFQDEKGNWMSYTFDSENVSLSRSPTPLDKAFDALLAVENLRRSENRSCSNAYCFKDYQLVAHVPHESQMKVMGLQHSARTVHIPVSFRKERDLNIVNVIKIRGSEISNIQNQSQCFRRRSNDREIDKSVKSVDICDLGSNIVSNSNSENESSLSLNSINVSPKVDVTASRSTFASFVRERFIVSQRNTVLQQSLGSNVSGPSPNYNFASLTLNELPHGDLKVATIYDGENDTTNNNNSLAVNNNNNNVCGQSSNTFPLERIADVSSRRTPFGLISETFFERSRQRNGPLHTATLVHEVQIPSSIIPGSDQEHDRNHFGVFDLYDLDGETERKCKPRHYYKLHYTPWSYVKVRFDRLELTALLDRNLTAAEIMLSLFLSTMVSACGIVLLNYGFYRDLFAFLFCFALAGCQYSLLKSVQPDATSPTHGYNRIVIYSRSIYFCVTSFLILILTEYLDEKSDFSFYLYGIRFTNNNLIKTLRDGLTNLLLFFPILFTLGLFPQINTFCLYLLEQIDIHLFGGNAMCSLWGAAFCIARSFVAMVFIYGFAYGALTEAKTTQHILFSIFCGLLISLSYHLSRSSSNPNILWDVLKDQLFQDEIREKNEYKAPKGQVEKSFNKTKSKVVNKNDDCDKFCSVSEAGNPETSSKVSMTAESQIKDETPIEDLENPENCRDRDYNNVSTDTSNKTSGKEELEQENFIDPLPEKLKETVNARLKNDAIICTVVSVFVFAIHCSTVFTTLQPDLNPILWGIAGCSGFILHYVIPELRKHLPWLCLAGPLLKSQEHAQFEVKNAAKVMWFEETYLILCFLERNLLYPVLILATVTYDGPRICDKFGVPLGALITSICGLKIMRSAFSNISQQYLIVIFSALLFEFDYHSRSETFLIDYFIIGIVFSKVYEFLLKIQFVVIYIAPWQITWGSAFHAFAQPFSVPHSAMLFVQAAVSAVLSAPLNPFLGSAIFLASYVRPIKFWERDYNTKRVDHSNTRMSSHLERNLGSDDNNLNSIFYEHLTRSLQHSLCGDLELGRWGPVYQGDCFVLASDYLNCLVHIVEMGNGLVTFQVRGLEFRGTYCQQREVEAISERVEDDDGCCCCELCHVPHVLSVNAAFSKRWLAWEVTASKYVLEGYSISDNSAASTLEVFDFRKVLVTYYVKSIIFYCVRSPKLQSWLTNPTILSALEPLKDRSFVDLDPVFNINIDQDFDTRAEGITRNSFCSIYLDWIQYCCSKCDQAIDKSLDSFMVSLCFALSLIGRRTLGTASHNTVSSVEFFLYGLHALFKGDFRITSVRDDWIFADMEFLTKVIAPGIRMSLKLHQDHFMSPDEYEDPSALFDAISTHEKNLVISHEGDPAWRRAVLSGKPSLLALRRVLDDGSDEYKIIMLNKRFLSFRVIKLNRECVRGLWAGQQQELVFLRNRNPERGSIQNAKQVLRNMINSSCDQPIGYPIYVSPLTTSYSDTNKQFTRILGGPLSLQGLKNAAFKMWRRIGQRCREGCSSGGGIVSGDEAPYAFGQEAVYALTSTNTHSGYGPNVVGNQFLDSSQTQLGSSNRGGSLGRSSLGGRGSSPSVGKPSTTLASLAGLLSSSDMSKGETVLRDKETSFAFVKEKQYREEKDVCKRHSEKKDEKEKKKEESDSKKDQEKSIGHSVLDHFKDPEDIKDKDLIYQRVRIIHPNLVFDAINLGRRIDVLWPDEGMRLKGGRSYWKDWLPDFGMEGQVVHRWVPNHRDPARRSNVDKTILLVKIDDKFVPIAEAGVQDLGVEV